MKIYALIPVYENVKSFYEKARVIDDDDNMLTLQSYNTNVAAIDTKLKKAVVFGDYSATTLRHIKEFLRQNGFKAETKSQIEKYYMTEVKQI